MNSSNWGFSSSSESDSDDDRPVSKIRTDTLFFQQFQNGQTGDDWPIELLAHSNHDHHRNANMQANSSILMDVNGHANTSFANLSRIVGLDDTRVVSPANILPADDIVLINDGGKFRPIRVISKTEILPPRKTPDGKSNIKKLKTELNDEEHHVPREIPLEQIDFIDAPKDPRKPKPDRDQFYDDADDDDSGLILPRFWRETILESAKNRDRKPHMNGSFRPSNSLIRERTLQKIQRLSMAGARRDPRLDRSLFAKPPQKIKSPSKAHNMSHPNIGTSASIFDCDAAENVSSAESAFSSSSESISSLPSASEDHFTAHNSTKVNANGNIEDLDDVSDSDDNDCSFTAFQKRKLGTKPKRAAKRAKRLESTSTNDDENVPLIKMNFKKTKQLTPSRDNKKNKLFNLPNIDIDKETILSALTDDTASEDQENVSTNASKVQTRSSAAKKAKKNQKKIVMTPISGGHNLKVPNTVRDISPNSSTNAKDTKANIVKPPKTVKASKTPKAKAQHNLSGIKVLKTESPISSMEATGQGNETLSEKSSTSIGSIEQRLAEMISPVKTAAEVRAEQNEQKLTEMLTDGNDIIATPTQENDNQLVEMMTTVEPMIVSEPTAEAAEDSGIQTANESPPSEGHSDSVEVIQSDDSAKNDIPSPVFDTAKSTMATQQQPATVNDIEPKTIFDALVADTVPQPQIPIAEMPEVAAVEAPTFAADDSAEMQTIAANLSFGSPEVGAHTEIVVAEFAKNLLESSGFNIDVEPSIDSNSPNKDGATESKKAERTRIIIPDFLENGNVAADLKLMMTTTEDAEISDDDYEDDQPCGMDALILPNSNTDRNANDTMKSSCNLCSYQATKGWKQLTKHYVRKHPKKEISISRLANMYNPQELQGTTFTPLITKECGGGTLIQSLCYICNEGYNMCSSKWLMHFIAHTGEFEFRCNTCSKEMMQDLHKKCNSKGNERINGPFDFMDNVLYGYVCGLCSYVQLSKKNVIAHLENEHQQLITGNDNVIEIILLKSTQPTSLNFFADDNKNDASLVKAKERMSIIHQPNRYQNFEPVIISDGDNDDSDDEQFKVQTIDLTLSDEEI